jgi:hypothetical protein
MKLSLIGRISLAIAASSLVSQAALAAPVCQGEYFLAAGVARPAVSGKLSGVPDPNVTGSVDAKVKECGRVLELTIRGQGGATYTVIRNQDDPAHYSGTWDGDAIIKTELVHVVDAPVHFDVLAPDHITGQFFAPGSPESATWEMTLVNGHTPDFENCDAPEATDEMADEDRLTIDPELRREAINIVADQLGVPREDAGRYISAARTVAKTQSRNDDPAVIQPGEGNCPIEFEGFRTCLEFPSDVTTIVETNVLLDKEGRLLPVTMEGSSTGRVRVDGPERRDICSQDKTPTPTADKRLRFKFFAIEEDGINDVQTMLVDAETDHAKAAHYAKGKHKGQRGRIDAASEAYEAIGAPVTGIN